VKFDAPVMILVAAAFPFIIWNGHIDRIEGLLLCVAIFFYTLWNFIMAKKSGDPEELAEFEEEVPKMLKNVLWDFGFIIGGLYLLIYGSRLLVDNSVIIARELGISEAVIGITIVAAGTSMPELVTCVVAAVRRHPDIAIGNVVGSNIFNILGVLGGAALAHPIISEGISQVDIWVMMAFSVLLLPMMWTDMKLRRIESVILLAGYCAYLAWLWPK
jgi:cation:H+ antiporter